jgi:hypothetical protein
MSIESIQAKCTRTITKKEITKVLRDQGVNTSKLIEISKEGCKLSIKRIAHDIGSEKKMKKVIKILKDAFYKIDHPVRIQHYRFYVYK